MNAISPAARNLRMQRGRSNLECYIGAGRLLAAVAVSPLQNDATFGAVGCASALHVMERPREALAEMRRVVATDGLVIAPTFLHGASHATRVLSGVLSAVSPFVAHSRFDLPRLVGVFRTSDFHVVHAETFPGLFPIGYVVARRPS